MPQSKNNNGQRVTPHCNIYMVTNKYLSVMLSDCSMSFTERVNSRMVLGRKVIIQFKDDILFASCV